MLSDLQKRKLRRLFQLTDFNGDGHIERADYEQSLNIFAEMRGVRKDSPEYKARYDAYMNQ